MNFDVDPGPRDNDGPCRNFASMKKNYEGLNGSSFLAETNDDPHKRIEEQPCARGMFAASDESATADEFARSIEEQLYDEDRGHEMTKNDGGFIGSSMSPETINMNVHDGEDLASDLSGSSKYPGIMEIDDNGGYAGDDRVAADALVNHPHMKANDGGYDEATHNVCMKGCIGNPPVDARRDELKHDAPVEENPLDYRWHVL